MKILMVCLGNICRSPMAEGILRHKSELHNKSYQIDSAGTSGYHIGEQPDLRAIKKMSEYGIDISDLKARQFVYDDFNNFDLILAMDESNYSNIIKLAKTDEERKKVTMILEYPFPNQRMSVPDPYFGGDSGFENVYTLLDSACELIIKKY